MCRWTNSPVQNTLLPPSYLCRVVIPTTTYWTWRLSCQVERHMTISVMFPGCRWCKADVLRREWSCSRFQHFDVTGFWIKVKSSQKAFSAFPLMMHFDKLQRQFHTCLLSYHPNQLLSSPLVLHTTAVEWCVHYLKTKVLHISPLPHLTVGKEMESIYSPFQCSLHLWRVLKVTLSVELYGNQVKSGSLP